LEKPKDFKILFVGARTSKGPNKVGKCHLFLKKQNIMFSFLRHRWPLLILAILFMPLDFLIPKDIQIIWLSNMFSLNVPDEDYSRNAPCALNLLFSFLFNNDYNN